LSFSKKDIPSIKEKIKKVQVCSKAWEFLLKYSTNVLSERVYDEGFAKSGEGQHGNYNTYSGIIHSQIISLGFVYQLTSKKEFAEKVDKAVFPYLQGGPHEHVIAAKAVCFKEAAKPEFKNYAAQIVKNAKALAEELIAQGFRLVSGGTDNHLILVDVFSKGITGQQAENALHNVGIYVNKNTIPFDTRKPFDPSGIRIGTPVLTTRGMQEEEMKYIGELIAKVLNNINNTEIQNQVHEDVIELCQNFQFYK